MRRSFAQKLITFVSPSITIAIAILFSLPTLTRKKTVMAVIGAGLFSHDGVNFIIGLISGFLTASLSLSCGMWYPVS